MIHDSRALCTKEKGNAPQRGQPGADLGLTRPSCHILISVNPLTVALTRPNTVLFVLIPTAFNRGTIVQVYTLLLVIITLGRSYGTV